MPVDRMASMSSILLLSLKNIRRVLTSKTKLPSNAEKFEKSLFDFIQFGEKGNRKIGGRFVWDGKLRMI